MSSWMPSWFTFPTFDASIFPNLQRKFFSFILKRFLGHFLKPGQLDVAQIDSAIGSGNFTINNLQLECTSINTLLSELPIQLHDGGIASVSVRIPWPNPLASSVELSIQSLDLVFHLPSEVTNDIPPSSTNLADSISEAAQLFAHEEITRKESTEAYQAFQSSETLHMSKNNDYVPGGLDTPKDDPEVLSDVEPIGVSMFASMFEYLLSQFTFSAKDIRIILIHPDRSSFRLKVSELHYGKPTSGPGESTRTINISGLEIAHRDLSTSGSTASGHSETRSLPSASCEFNAASHRVDNVSLTPTISIPSSPPPSSSPVDRSGSNESVPPVGSSPPEDRSRPSSASGSTSSSIFHSVLTSQGSKLEPGSRETTVTHLQDAGADDMEQNQSGGTAGECSLSQADEAVEDGSFHQVLFSLATEPIVIHVTTSAMPSVQTQSGAHDSEPDTSEPDARQTNLETSVSVGIVACALNAAQISSILDVVSMIGSHSRPSTAPPASNSASSVVPTLSLLDQATLTIQIRGLVLLLQSSPAPLSSSSRNVFLADFFTHPLTPPKSNHSYIRFLIDRVGADLSVSTTLEQLEDEYTPSPEHLPGRGQVPRVVRGTTSSHIRFSVGDLSAFAFCMDGNATSSHLAHQAFALPIVLTDSHLFTQYHPEHHFPSDMGHYDVSPDLRQVVPALPEFGIIDWTLESNRTSHAKLSLWRVRPPPSYRRSQKSFGGDPSIAPPVPSSPKTISEGTSANKPQSALSGRVLLSSPKDPGRDANPGSTCSIQIDVIPLHVFADMGSIPAALDFLEMLSIPQSRSGSSEPEVGDHGDACGGDNSGDLTPLSSPYRNTLQQIHEPELEDLNRSVDYLSKKPVAGGSSQRTRKKTSRHTQDQSHHDGRTEFDINFAMIRVQIRCPSPPSRQQRSGSAILDVHALRLTSRSPLGAGVKYPHRFGTKTESRYGDLNSSSRDNHVLIAEWRTLLLACSSAGAETARGFCSIGPLFSAADGEAPTSHDHTRFQDVLPLVKLSQAPSVPSGRNSGRSAAVIVEIDIPSVLLNFSKPIFDSLQFWIDDVSQLLERTTAPSSEAAQENSSRNSSLVGSRFFSASKHGSEEMDADERSAGHVKSSTESVAKVTISEGSVRLLMPRITGEFDSIEPFDIFVSDVDVLLESKPEGKNETVVTLSMMRMTVQDAANPFPYSVFSLAAPRSLFSTPKPIIRLQFSSMALPENNSKESRIKLSLNGFLLNVFPNMKRIDSLVSFARPPPGVFESVIPSERTRIAVNIEEGSARLFAPRHAGAFVLHLGDVEFATEMVGDSPEIRLRIAARALTTFFTDNHVEVAQELSNRSRPDVQGPLYWKKLGYALITEGSDLALTLGRSNNEVAQSEIIIDHINIRIHLCADTGSTLGLFFGDFGTAFEAERSQPSMPDDTSLKRPTVVSAQESSPDELTYSIDQHAFQDIPEVGAAPDMIYDDLPSNPDYLDVAFGAAAGLRELDDDDLDMDDQSQGKLMDDLDSPSYSGDKGVVSSVGGETIRLLDTNGLHIVENFFNTLPALVEPSPQLEEVLSRIVVRGGDITLFLYEGYDWATTRKVIEDEIKKMRRRLTRIKQLVASGQTYDPSIDSTNTLLFNSIHVGLDQDVDEIGPDALIAAIDEQLVEDNDTASVSSWQSLQPASSGRPNVPPPRLHGRRLTRSRNPSIEFHLSGVFTETVQFAPNDEIVSRTFATVKDVEILDHVKTSTWRKFLTSLRSDSHGNIRETGSDMVRIELRGVHPVPGRALEETRLRVKILPLRLHVDQDALDFLKKFFNFVNPNSPIDSGAKTETYLPRRVTERAEVYPVVLKLDYKPRRVDYRALREGRTIELMNFFHFDGAEMTLRHLTLFGVAGWPRFFDMLNDLWTPDVKATQLADVVSGVSPIRSVVNVGSGVADLVLLPIAQYRKDGRVVRGLQKGTKAFVRSTATEAVKLGAQLATGTQVILEQAENVLGSKFNETILAETLPHPSDDAMGRSIHSASDEETADPISRYAEQPVNIQEGIQSAYTSMRRNLSSAAQTILAVPMEVFERSGSEGPVRAVIRAVPIAVLRPMIGASEAVSKTLLGLHNSMDPEIRHETAAKYKHR